MVMVGLKELHLIRWLDKALTQTLLDIDNLKMNNLWKQAFTFFKVKLSQQVLKTFPVDKDSTFIFFFLPRLDGF